MKNDIKEIGKRPYAMNARLEEAEEWFSDLEDQIMENNEAEQKRKGRIMEHKSKHRELNDTIK